MDATLRMSFDNLPDEVIEHVFSFCSNEDLSMTLQYVCMRWQHVSHRNSLWSTYTYRVLMVAQDQDVIKRLKASPELQSVEFEREFGIQVYRTLLECCPHMKKIKFWSGQNLKYEFLQLLVNKCPNLEELALSERSLHEVENCKLIANLECLKVLNILRYRYACTMNLTPLALGSPALESLMINTPALSVYDVKSIVDVKKNKLSSLAVCCYSDYTIKCPLTVLPVCTALRNLTIFQICYESLKEKEESLRNLKCLRSLTWIIMDSEPNDIAGAFQGDLPWPQLVQLHINSKYVVENADSLVTSIAKKCVSLKHLTLICSFEFSDIAIRSLLKMRSLQYLFLNVESGITLEKDLGTQTRAGMRVLKMMDCALSPSSMSMITTLHQLKVLDIMSCDVAGIEFDLFPIHLRHLRKLSIRLCRNVAITDVQGLKNFMPNLHIVFKDLHSFC